VTVSRKLCEVCVFTFNIVTWYVKHIQRINRDCFQNVTRLVETFQDESGWEESHRGDFDIDIVPFDKN
jgi:hypothetical protein